MLSGSDKARARSDGPGLKTQFVRFIVVGGINTVVDLAVLNALIFGFDAGREGALFAVFKTAAFAVAVANSYVLNKLWTFESKDTRVQGTLVPFLVISLVGLVLNVGTAAIFATYLPAPHGLLEPLWPSVASLTGTAAGLVWNFVGYRTMVFVPGGKKMPLPEVEVDAGPEAAIEPLSS